MTGGSAYQLACWDPLLCVVVCTAREGPVEVMEQRWYRVVYYDGKRARGLGRIAELTPTRNTLDPFLSRLLLAGVDSGELLLVDESTKRVTVRRGVNRNRR